MSPQQDGQRAPDQKRDNHDGGDLHDAQSLAAGFVDTLSVHPPKIDRNQRRKKGREVVYVEWKRLP